MKADDLNWEDIRYFLEVARKGRLLSAAKKIGVNHTTVARRINSLEKALAVKLFEQDATGFHLTPSGEALMPLAQQFDDLSDLVREQVRQHMVRHAGSLRVGAPDGFGNSFLAPRLAEFLAHHPDLTIELVPVPNTHNLSKREVDLAISLEPSKNKNIWCRKITDYVLFVYGSKDFIQANGICVDTEDNLARFPFADYIPDILYTEELSFNPHISAGLQGQFQSSTVLAQQQFVVNGGGLGVLPNFMACQDPRLVRVRPDKYSFTRSYWLLIPYDVRRLARVRGLEQAIGQMVKTSADIFRPGVHSAREPAHDPDGSVHAATNS